MKSLHVLIAALTFVAVGCGDDGAPEPLDSGGADAGPGDAGARDAGGMDATSMDATSMDASMPPDARGTDSGRGDAGETPDAGQACADAGGTDAGGCPGMDPLWCDVDLDAFGSIAALDELELDAVIPASPATYFELRRGGFGDDVIGASGTLCSAAADMTACLADFAALSAGSGFGPGCPPGSCYYYLAVNDGDSVSTVTTIADLVAFLAPIDAEEEAVLVAFAHGFDWSASDKSVGGVQSTGGGYRLLLRHLSGFCAPVQSDRVLLAIETDGTVSELRRQIYSALCGACI